MVEMFEFMKILNEVTQLEIDRNEALKNSQYAAFAVSDESVKKNAMHTASKKFKETTTKNFMNHFQSSIIRVR